MARAQVHSPHHLFPLPSGIGGAVFIIRQKADVGRFPPSIAFGRIDKREREIAPLVLSSSRARERERIASVEKEREVGWGSEGEPS